MRKIEEIVARETEKFVGDLNDLCEETKRYFYQELIETLRQIFYKKRKELIKESDQKIKERLKKTPRRDFFEFEFEEILFSIETQDIYKKTKKDKITKAFEEYYEMKGYEE